VSTTSVLSAEVVQQAIDQAAHFNLCAVPDPHRSDAAISGGSGGIIGIRAEQILHRLHVICRQPTTRTPITARTVVGEPVARLTQRWMAMADDAVPQMDRDPPPIPIDSSRSQRFAMLDTVCTFANGEDGFRAFGTGLTLPTPASEGPPQLLALAVGTIVEGFGRFKGKEEGTYVFCGRLSPQTGLSGNFLLRVIDTDETFRTANTLAPIAARAEAEQDVTYIVFRGQAIASDPVTPRLGADGRPRGLIVEQGLRLLDLDCIGRGRPFSSDVVGPAIGRITANVSFNPMAPGGSIRDPIPFRALDEFVFDDPETGRRVGSFTADSIEGRVFRTSVLGVSGIRFGGVGRILGGQGVFKGIRGLMTDNSVVTFTPHVSASVYVLRVQDPEGRFSARIHPERRPARSEDR